MSCNITNCLKWSIIGFVCLAVVFKIFRKKVFAAFCSNMFKGPLLCPAKAKLFEPLNEQAKKAGPHKLKVP